ncbi:pyridoxal 5'-phosphate synthase glutaminase subunit PdxT [Caldicellulosiruptoraceae bacterium PP1]
MLNIGVLGFQGGVIEHIEKIKKLGHNAILVKYINQLDSLDGLILPGGESTTIGLFLKRDNFKEVLLNKINSGLPVFGTCAGVIVLSKRIKNQSEIYMPVLDITIERNAYGSQIDSFMDNIYFEKLNIYTKAVFIRAPKIIEVSENVEVLARLDTPIAIQQGNILAATFHPELTDETIWHEYFISMITEKGC